MPPLKQLVANMSKLELALRDDPNIPLTPAELAERTGIDARHIEKFFDDDWGSVSRTGVAAVMEPRRSFWTQIPGPGA